MIIEYLKSPLNKYTFSIKPIRQWVENNCNGKQTKRGGEEWENQDFKWKVGLMYIKSNFVRGLTRC